MNSVINSNVVKVWSWSDTKLLSFAECTCPLLGWSPLFSVYCSAGLISYDWFSIVLNFHF
jgi:hypothetical protein